jgi:PhnB protein
MRLDIYLNYAGTCEEAFRLYEKELGGKITMIRRHADAPNPNIPADWKEKVLHAQIELGNATLMGADVPTAQPVRSAYVSLTVDSVKEAERLYEVLQQGGEVFMKMDETFFAKRFGMLRDRFGTSWMLLHGVRDSA